MNEPVSKKRKKKDENKEDSREDSPLSLDLLPEILEKIFGYLDCADLRNCCLVNGRWREEARKKIIKCIIQLSDFDNLDRTSIWDYTETSIFKEQIKITTYNNNTDYNSEDKQDSSSWLPIDERASLIRFKIHRMTLDDLRIKLNQSNVKGSYQIFLRADIKTICELKPEIRDAIFYESCHLITHLSLSSSPLHNHRTRYSIPVNKFLHLLQQFLPKLESLTFENSSLLSLEPPSKRVTTHSFTEADGELEKSQQQLLVNLKTICFKTPFQFHEMSSTPIYHILKNSPNLQNIRGFPFQFLNKLHATKKVHALKSLRLVNHNYCSTYSLAHLNVKSNNEFENVVILGNEANLKALKKLSQTAISFEELKIFICFKDTPQKLKKNAQIYKNIFTTLLTGSADTLTRLDVQPFEFINFLNFPLPLKNLKTLGLHGDNPAPLLKAKPDRKFFPNDFNINVVFPNLTSVDLSIHIRDAAENPVSIFHDFFPTQDFYTDENDGSNRSSSNSSKNCNTFKCIQNLKILRYMPLSCMAKLAALFSNVSTLTLELTTFTDLRKIIRMIFELSTRHCWSRLQRLFIDLKRVRGRAVGTNYWNLDEEITGVTNQKCEILRQDLKLLSLKNEDINNTLDSDDGSKGDDEDVEDIEMYRLYPSILSMKELRLLEFILPMWIEQEDEPILIFSQVSSIYGFAMLPLLRVHIGFRDYFRYKSPQRLKPLVQNYIGQLYFDEDDEDA